MSVDVEIGEAVRQLKELQIRNGDAFGQTADNGTCRSPEDALAGNPTSASGRFRYLSEVEPRPVEWLWLGRIPLGGLTVIEGDPGTNKSTLSLDIAARLSSGKPLPLAEAGGKTELAKILLFAGEDAAETIRSRLEAAGADLAKIAVADMSFSFPRDSDILRAAIVETGARLVILDPFVVFLGVSSAREQIVRQALAPLVQLATEMGCAIVAIRHLIKSSGANCLYRGGGSVGIIAVARSALLVSTYPEDPNLRIVSHLKSNLGPRTRSLVFEPIGTANGQVAIEWRGECDLTAEDLHGGARSAGEKIQRAENFLVGLLAKGPMEQRLIREAAAQEWIAYRTVERAKANLGVLSERTGYGSEGCFLWRLPDSETP